MPAYDYKCDKGHEFIWVQPITEEPLEMCPRYVQRDPGNTCAISTYVCNAPCHRLISKGTGFTLKGRGWAKDGYSS